jgi:hypothetical protein
VVCTEEKRNAYRILVRRTKAKRLHGRSRRRWEVTDKKIEGRAQTGYIWLRAETNSGVL